MMKKKTKGFTLIELMMIIIILSVLSMVAVPAFDRSFKKASVNKLTEQLEGSLRLARLNAMSRGENVIVCPVADINNIIDFSSISCLDKWTELNAVDGNLNKGWVVFSTLTTSPPFNDLTEEKNLIQVIHFDGANGKAFFDENLTNLNRPSFSRRGYGSNGTIGITTNGFTEIGRKLIVSNSGRVKNDSVQ